MIIILELGVLGLCLGSLVNAVVWRLHEQDELAQKKGVKDKKARLKKLSILRGRSMCPHCGHELAAKDLVPVLSWGWLRGKCRYCRAPIGWQYPLVEIATALLFIGSYALWPVALHGLGLMQLCFWLVFLVGFMVLAVCDLRWYWLPSKAIYPLVGVALAELVATLIFFDGGWAAVWSSVCGVLIASGIFFVLYQISHDWIGDGDIRLGLVLGILLGGPMRSIILLLVASILGTLASVPALLVGKAGRKTLIPFGPFLLLGAVVVQLFGTSFTDWLQRIPG